MDKKKAAYLSAIRANASLRGRMDAIVTLTDGGEYKVGDMWDTLDCLFQEVEDALMLAFNESDQ